MMQIKRAYDPPARGDGQRLLVERLWPRGMKKEALAFDGWLKDVAPSSALRTWYGHRVERWDEFQRRYRDELDSHPDAWAPIAEAAARGPVTLLYSAHDTAHNSAAVLRDYLGEHMPRRPRRAAASRSRKAAPSRSRKAAPSRAQRSRTPAARSRSSRAARAPSGE